MYTGKLHRSCGIVNHNPASLPVDLRDASEAFRAAMADAGLRTDEPIITDGTLQRFHVEGDRRGSRNGWYVLYSDSPFSGAFGSWKTGTTQIWSMAGRDHLTSADRAEIRRRMEAARTARRAEQDRQYREAAGRARGLWANARPARADHPYLQRKGVAPGTTRQQGACLVLPVTDLDGTLWSLQFIDADGGKKLLTGGRKRGNCILVAGAMAGASRILICEGWATGASLAEMAPEALVLAAIDAGNLEPVAVAVRQRWPKADVVICCDADEVGLAKGRAAAIQAGAGYTFPVFPEGAEGSDFNDLVNLPQAVAR